MGRYRVVIALEVDLVDAIQAQVSTMSLGGSEDGADLTVGPWPVASDVDRVSQAVAVAMMTSLRPALDAAGITMLTGSPTVFPAGPDGTYPAVTIPG